MKKTNTTIAMLVEASAAVSHLALKRGRLFAVGSNIAVRSIGSPTKLKWLCAQVPCRSKKPWDQAHEIADRTERELGQAAFVEPDAGESRYSRLVNPQLSAPLRAPRPGNPLDIPGNSSKRFLLSARTPGLISRGARSSSPFGPEAGAMGMPGIRDPLADIMSQISSDIFGQNAIPEPFGDSGRTLIDLVRKVFEALPQWSGSSIGKQQMYVTEAAQILASSKNTGYAFDCNSLLESLKNAPDISGALARFISKDPAAG